MIAPGHQSGNTTKVALAVAVSMVACSMHQAGSGNGSSPQAQFSTTSIKKDTDAGPDHLIVIDHSQNGDIEIALLDVSALGHPLL